MGIKFIGDRTKIVTKDTSINKTGPMFRRRATVVQQIINGTATITPAADYYTKMLLHFDDADRAADVTIATTGVAPMKGVLTPDGTKIYFGSFSANNTTTNQIKVIDVATNTITNSITTLYANKKMVINSTGTRVYSPNLSNFTGVGSCVSIIDTATNTLLTSVTIPGKCNSVAITPNDKFLFVTSENDPSGGGLYRIDLSSTTLSATNLGDTTWGTRALITSADGTKLYVATSTTLKVYSLNQITGAVSLLSTLTGFANGSDFVSKNSTTAYFTNGNSIEPVSFSDSTKGTSITLPNSSTAYDVSFSLDGKKLFVPDSGSRVYVIDTTLNKVIETLSGYSSPFGCVATNTKLYVFNWNISTATVKDITSLSDSAQSPLTQYRVGTVNTSTTQSKFGGKSLALNGTNTNKLQFANPKGKAINFGSSNWTMEGWFYFNQKSIGYQPLIATTNFNGDVPGLNLYLEANSCLAVEWRNDSVSGTRTLVQSSFNPDTSRWYHIAAVRNGGTVTLYVDGTSVASGAVSGTLYVQDYIGIGVFGWAQSIAHFNGYMDGIRIQIGEAVYTGNFTAPTSAPVANSYTKLLMNFDSKIKDESALSVYSYAVGTTAVISSAQSKFGGSSLKMSGGTTDYVKIHNESQPIAFLDRPFTIEGWFWFNAVNKYHPLVNFTNTSNGPGPSIWMAPDGTLWFGYSTSSATTMQTTVSSTGVPTANAWHHIALVRESKGGSIKLYCDGVLKSTSVTSSELWIGENIYVGHYPYTLLSPAAQTLDGYIDEVRITLDQCKYNAAFTPPTAPFTLWGSETQPARRVAPDANDMLVWDFDETTGTYLNRGTAGMLNLYPKSGATVASAAGVFNNAVSFNGTGGVISNTTSLGETSGDFSMSCWAKLNSVSIETRILQKWYYADDRNSSPWHSAFIGTGTLPSLGTWFAGVVVNGSFKTVTISNGEHLLSANVWYHFGLSYNSVTGLLSVYKNGVLVGTVSGSPGSISWNDHGRWVVGSSNSPTGVNSLNGSVDDVRVAHALRDAAYFQSLYASGPNTASYSFAANTLPGLKVWYKADAITGVSDGAALTSWIDSSGNGKNLSGYGATYQRLGINGRPSVKMQGGDLSATNTGTPTGSSAVTAYSVVIPRNNGELWGIGDNNSGRLGLYYDSTQKTIGFEGQGKGTAFTSQLAEQPIIVSYPYVTNTHMGANPVYINGVSSGVGANNGILSTGSQNITLGHIPGYGGFYGDSDIAEILVYNTTHTTAERQQVEAYLAAKYGITVAT